jgi:16S rRNA (guanine527-N7)-methyltransferase
MQDLEDYNNAKNYLLNEQNVSRETFLQLEQYVELLLKWNEHINLISSNSAKHIWTRHILDSAQLIKYLDLESPLMDVGSGSGLPGLVVSILGVKEVHLVDRDLRKCIFLQEAKKFSKNTIKIHNCLFNDANTANIINITSRAFSNITKFLEDISQKIDANGNILLLKGKSWESELDEAKHNWNFDYKISQSITDELGMVIQITNIMRK